MRHGECPAIVSLHGSSNVSRCIPVVPGGGAHCTTTFSESFGAMVLGNVAGMINANPSLPTENVGEVIVRSPVPTLCTHVVSGSSLMHTMLPNGRDCVER